MTILNRKYQYHSCNEVSGVCKLSRSYIILRQKENELAKSHFGISIYQLRLCSFFEAGFFFQKHSQSLLRDLDYVITATKIPNLPTLNFFASVWILRLTPGFRLDSHIKNDWILRAYELSQMNSFLGFFLQKPDIGLCLRKKRKRNFPADTLNFW